MSQKKFGKVVVTGASQGIGRALAESFARRGADVLLVARSEAKLREAATAIEKKHGVKAHVLVLDLSKPDAARKLVAHCREKGFDADTLVNNAGYGLWGKFSELGLQEQLDCLQVNATTLVQTTHEFLPFLRENAKKRCGKAHVLNVSSSTAYQAIPTFAIYAAAKSFVLSFGRAIHHELRPEGVVVTTLVPGATETGFIDRAGMQHTAEKAKKVSMTAEAVAEIGVKALESGKIEAIAGGLNILMAGATRFLPKRFLESTAEGIYRKQ
jgi:short-subunit dehydrogenase